MKNYGLSDEVGAVISYYFVNYGKFLSEVDPLYSCAFLLFFKIIDDIWRLNFSYLPHVILHLRPCHIFHLS